MRICPPLAAHLESQFPGESVANKKASDVFGIVNDLAERRNAVAHGVVDDILSNEILLEYVDYFEKFGRALYEIVRNDALAIAAQRGGVNVGRAIMVIDNRIVCLRVNGFGVKVGDLLIAETGSSPVVYVGGEILQMQKNNQDIAEAVGDTPEDIALRIEGHVKDNHGFFIIPRARRGADALL
jgi:hypothetical protein